MKLRNKKTGEIGDLIGTERSCPFITIDIDFHDGNPRTFDYNSLTELNEEWEDYNPAEPLIKDEKIRKAVRAWAEANKITNIYCYQYKRTCEFDCENLDLDCYATIRFIGDDIIDKRHNNDVCTITELCGEEEE